MKKLIPLVGALLIVFQCSAQLDQFQDTIYHFSFDYPDSWVQTDGFNKNHRARITSEDGSVRLEAYGIFVEAGYIDIETFAEKDTSIFPLLGAVTETENVMVVPYIGEYLAYLAEGADDIIEIRKKYLPNKNGEYAISYFAVDEHYAYALIAYSKSENFEDIEEVFDSFEKTSTARIRQENNQSSVHREKVFYKALTWFLIFIYFFLLMFAGRNFKKFSRQRKTLLKFKSKQTDVSKTDRRWQHAFKRATRKYVFAIGLCVFLLIAGISLNPSNWYIYLAVPGAFIMGYFGFTLVVDDPE